MKRWVIMLCILVAAFLLVGATTYSIESFMERKLHQELHRLQCWDRIDEVARMDGYHAVGDPMMVTRYRRAWYVYGVFQGPAGDRFYYCEWRNCIPRWVGH